MKKNIYYIYLLLGFTTMVLSNGKYLYGISAFIFPIFLLLAIENMKPLKAVLLMVLTTSIANSISFYNMLPDIGMPLLNWIPAMAGGTLALPFIVQYFTFKKSKSFSTTLILPGLYTLIDYANATFNPFGSFGVLGYSQHNFLVVAQLASIVGAVGLTFIIIWFGSAFYWMIKNRKYKSRNRYLLGFIIVTVMVLIFGGMRLYSVDMSSSYSVSGLHTLDRTVQETADLFSNFENDPEEFKVKSEENIEKVLELTRQEASNGAQVVSHGEATLVVSYEQKDSTLKRISKLADEEDIVIVTTLYVLNNPPNKHENVLYTVDNNGTIMTEHYKYGGNVFEGSVEGDRILQAADTKYGTLSGIICWDKDFPQTVNQVGDLNVDSLFIPSADWKEISPYHTIIGTFRGIENGSNVITQTVNGMSSIVDYTGRVINEMDHFTNTIWINRGQLPVKGVRTIYTYICDYVIWIVILILLYSFTQLFSNKKII